MISSRTQLFVLLLFVVAALAACDPGKASSWSDLKDTGAEDTLSHDDAISTGDVDSFLDSTEEPPDAQQPDVADVTETPDTTSPPDTTTPEEPDTTEPQEPDVSEPEPDITEPDPPSWSCSAVSCNEVDVSTSLGSMRDIDA